VDDRDDDASRRAAWQRQQQRVRRGRDFGLLVLTLGVLLLAYVAILAGNR